MRIDVLTLYLCNVVCLKMIYNVHEYVPWFLEEKKIVSKSGFRR